MKRASKKDVKEEPVLEQSTLDVFAHDAVLQAMAEIAETYIREVRTKSDDFHCTLKSGLRGYG